LFLDSYTSAYTRQPILVHNSSKDAVWRKEDPFYDEKCVIMNFEVFYPKKPKIGQNGHFPEK